jgi:peptidoglycan/LPS O-acetylase OafA/YrhL
MTDTVHFVSTHASKTAARIDTRIVALDGLRGLMTIVVVISHYFGEVANGIAALAAGFVVVNVFFVLSGYLVGRLILEKMHCANFLTVFYVRRICRTLPVYIVCVAIVNGFIQVFRDEPWVDAAVTFPLWSYLTFTQNFFMIQQNAIGAHWLAPTWTLAVEEHFYLVGPALFFIVPRRWLLTVLLVICVCSILGRGLVFWGGAASPMAANTLLPFMSYGIVAGLIAAVLIKDDTIRWHRYDLALRIIPIFALIGAATLKLVDGGTGKLFEIFSFALISVGSASYILSIVRGAPEAKRLESKLLCFFGTTSYSVYLTHLLVLGLLHGLVLGTIPDIATPVQFALTLAALPLSALAGFVMTELVEAPLTRYGRSWAWSRAERPGTSAASSGTALA